MSNKGKSQLQSQSGGKKQANKPGYEPRFLTHELNRKSQCVIDLRRFLQFILDPIAEKYNVRKLNIMNIEAANTPYDDSFESQTWSWNEKFFSKFLLQAEAVRFEQVWWQDQLIDQISIMVWNLAWRTIRETWKETGTYPGADKLPRKIRNSDEGVAEHFANSESKLFEANFK